MNETSQIRTNKERYGDTNDTNDTNDTYQTYQKNQTYQRITSYKEFLVECSIPEKMVYYYLDEGPLSDEEMSKLIGCSSETVRASGRNRLSGIYKATEDRPSKFCIRRNDAEPYLTKFEHYLLELKKRENKNKEIEAKALIPKGWREYLTQDTGDNSLIEKAISTYLKTGEPVFYLNVADVAINNPDLADHLTEDPRDAHKIVLKIVNDEFSQTYGSPGNKTVKWDVEIRGNRERGKIARIRAANAGQLVSFDVEVVAKGELYDKATTSRYECLSCGDITPVLQKLENPFRTDMKKCLKCKSKSVKLLDEETHTVQDVTVQDVAESLLPSEQPRTLPCIIMGGIAERTAEKLNVTDKVLVSGCYIREQIPRKADFKRVLLVLGIENLSEDDLQAKTTPEAKEEVQRIRECEDPLREVSKIVFSHLDGLSFEKEVCALLPFGRLHALLLGESGLGKTALSKAITDAFPRSEFFQSSFSSKVGLTASVWKDVHTGRFVMGQNGLVRLSPHGTAIVDEIEKADEEVHHSLLGVMEDRVLRIRKATIQQDLPCDVQIIGTANPKRGKFGSYDDLHDEVELPAALKDRFNIKLVFIREHRSLDVRKLLGLRKKKEEGLSSLQRLVIRDLWMSGWKTNVCLDEEVLDKVVILINETVLKHPEIYGDSMRAMELVPCLMEALCRLTGEKTPSSYHFRKTEEILRGLEQNHKEALVTLGRRSG